MQNYNQSKKISYCYIKIGSQNFLLEYWLDPRNVFNHSVVGVYFGIINEKEVYYLWNIWKKSNHTNDMKAFYKDLNEKNQKLFDKIDGKNKKVQWRQLFDLMVGISKKSLFLTIYESELYVFSLTGQINDLPESSFDKYEKDLERNFEPKKIKNYLIHYNNGNIRNIPKLVRITDEIKKISLLESPMLIASLGSFQKYSQMTCKKIDDEEIINTLSKILFNTPIPKKLNLLWYLSPLEFETLVFLLFYNLGFFVQTIRGGSIKDFDLKVVNRTNRPIYIIKNQFKVRPDEKILLQVKRKRLKENKEIKRLIQTYSNLFFVCIEGEGPNMITKENIIEMLKSDSKTIEWLKYVLNWVDNFDELLPLG